MGRRRDRGGVLKLQDGTAIEETVRQVGRLEAAAQRLGATNIYARVGTATDEEVLAGADPGSSSSAQLLLPLPAGDDAGQFARRLREAVPDLARGALAIDLAGQSEFGSLIGREGRVVRVEVSAARPDDAARWADSLRSVLAGLTTLADVREAFSGTQPSVEVTLERGQIAERNLSVCAVSNAIAGGLGSAKGRSGTAPSAEVGHCAIELPGGEMTDRQSPPYLLILAQDPMGLLEGPPGFVQAVGLRQEHSLESLAATFLGPGSRVAPRPAHRLQLLFSEADRVRPIPAPFLQPGIAICDLREVNRSTGVVSLGA